MFFDIQKSFLIDLHHIQDTLNFISNEGTLDLPTYLSEIVAIQT